MSARAFWLMLALTGPIVGVCFIDGVRAFAEVSEGAGNACGIVCAPLIGIWGPTFSAYEIVAVFLLPFVAIRLASADRQSGAEKLELQRRLSPFTRVGSKALVLVGGWLITYMAAGIAVVLWKAYGGSVYVPELTVVALGHAVNAAMTIALATAFASMTEHPSTAAIATLGVTIGTWIVTFAAAVHGGFWESLAAWTPAAMVSVFQHALLRADLLLAATALSMSGLAIAAVWTKLGTTTRVRVLHTAGVLAATALVVTACAFVRGSWDASESRQNSFGQSDEEALEHLAAPLNIEARLAQQDPRRLELERGPFKKLRRVVPELHINYLARSTTGLFEEADAGYGEVHYQIGEKTVTSRVVTEDGVLESIFSAAGIEPPDEDDSDYHGHPLVAQPVGAALTFYLIWPAVIAGFHFLRVRRPT